MLCVLRVWIALLFVVDINSLMQAAAPKEVYATYVGPSARSYLNSLAVDAAGFAYIAGTDSASHCGLLTKISQRGDSPVWTKCLPTEEIDAVVLDSAGFIYVTGRPAYQPGPHSQTVMKLAPDGETVMFQAKIDGLAYWYSSLAVDSGGSVYLAGNATSAFAPTIGAYSFDSTKTTFAVKLNSDGTLAFATYLPLLSIYSMAVDQGGQMWLAGTECGSPANCGSDRFGTMASVMRLGSDGSQVTMRQAFGGGTRPGATLGYLDAAFAISVDSNDNAWVAGSALSASVPTTVNALVPQRPSVERAAYVLKFGTDGVVVYGSYIGGLINSPTLSIGFDGAGQPYFPLVTSLQQSTIVGLSADGTAYTMSQSYGTQISRIALDGQGGLFIAGAPRSTATAFAEPCPTTVNAIRDTDHPTYICVARFDMYQTSDSQVFVPLSAASQNPASMVPGELVTINGLNLPAQPVVTFDTIPAMIVASSPDQITAVVPAGINSGWTSFAVEGVGNYSLGVWPSALALFTADGLGTGQLDARNADGSINSAQNPADAGSTVSLFVTGDGGLPVFVMMNDAPVQVGSISSSSKPGVLQVDIQIPPATTSGDAVVKVNAGIGDPGAYPWQPKTTLAVR